MEDFEDYTVESVVRGHQSVWTPVIVETLTLLWEDGNLEDEYAVAIMKTGTVVGHVPHELSRIFFSLQHGDTIQCIIASWSQKAWFGT